MLVITRQRGQKLFLTTPSGERITICVVSINGSNVRIGIDAKREIAVHRDDMKRGAA